MSNIEWTDATWNPVRGCSRVSAGCDHCYAMGQAHRFSGPGKPYDGLTTIRRGKVDWSGSARLVPEMLGAPLKWRKPRRVFVNSMSDLFHEALSNEEIAAAFMVMAACPQHTFQVLTKRPKRMRDWFAWAENFGAEHGPDGPIGAMAKVLSEWPHPLPGALSGDDAYSDEAFDAIHREWPLPNVWLGVSCEDQKAADERIPLLLETPAAVRFVSAEPLLWSMSLSRFMWPVHRSWPAEYRSLDEALKAGAATRPHRQALVAASCVFVDWVIVGGESGPGARPCNIEWIRSIVSECEEAGVPVFVKQLGAKPFTETGFPNVDQCAESIARHGEYDPEPDAYSFSNKKGGDPSEWPEDLRVREFPR